MDADARYGMSKALCSAAILWCVLIAPAQAQAITCGQFTALGPAAGTVKQVLDAPASEAQVTAYKKVIADHASGLSFTGFSARSKALALVRRNGQLTMVMRESLAMTRVFCYEKPGSHMRDTAIEQFNYLLDAIAKRMQQGSMISREVLTS